MANYKAVIGAVRRLTDPTPDGLGMSARGVTVSTVGLVPRMLQLAEEGIPVTLALSLHAPDDELRDELVPVNTRWKVGEAVDAAWNYARTTKRRVSIEYAMMRGINDQGWRADLLADVLLVARRLGLGPRQPDPAQPDARLEVDRQRSRATSASSCGAWRRRASRPRSATPAAARSTGPAASSPPRPDQADPATSVGFLTSSSVLRSLATPVAVVVAVRVVVGQLARQAGQRHGAARRRTCCRQGRRGRGSW